MNVIHEGKCIVHIASKHFGKPMVNAGKHAEERRNSHHQVKMGNNEICIMQVDINGGIP